MPLFNNKRIGIKIHDNTLVLCEIKEELPGQYEIRSMNVSEIPKGVIKNGRVEGAKELKNLILKTIETAKPRAIESTECIFEVPEEYTFQHTMVFPVTLNEAQVRDAVVIQAEKLLPFDLDQVSWDIKIIPQKDKQQLVLFTAVPLDFIQEYYDVFIDAGLMPLGFSLHVENLMNSISNAKSGATVLIDLQHKYMTVLFFEGQNIRALEQINIGVDDLKKIIQQKYDLPKKNLGRHLRELSEVDIDLATLSTMKKIAKELSGLIENFVDYMEKDYPDEGGGKKSLKSFRFLFSGDELFMGTFQKYFSKHLPKQLQPLQTNFKNLVNLSPRDLNRLYILTKKVKKPSLKRLIPSAIGASLADYGVKGGQFRPINLLPPMVRSIALWKETSGWFYVLATFMLIFSVSWLMVFGFFWGDVSAKLKVSLSNHIMVERQLEIKKSKSTEEKIRSANEELKVINDLESNNILLSKIIEEFSMVVPDIFFISLQYGHHQDKSLFEWKGRVATREDAIKIHESVKTLAFVDKVIFPPSNLDNKEQVEFSILFNLKDDYSF